MSEAVAASVRFVVPPEATSIVVPSAGLVRAMVGGVRGSGNTVTATESLVVYCPSLADSWKV